MFGPIIRFKVYNQTIEIEFEERKGTITVINDDIMKIFSDYVNHDYTSKAIEHLPGIKAKFEVTQEADSVTIRTKSLVAKVYDEFKVDFYKSNGELLCRDYRKERKVRQDVSEEVLSLMAQEGHQIALESANHKVQVIKAFEGDEWIYGLGDRTGFLNKKGYIYELWNTDDPKPHVDSFKTLYKSIPFTIILREKGVYGIFFDNTNRSFWDLGKESQDYYYFASEQGNLEYYFISGEHMTDVIKGYTLLTGTVPLPQLWTLGYQQSRWGYETEGDIRNLAKKMRENRIPCDVIHLDIDYMENYKVFTWNQKNYENPKKLFQDLSEEGFKIVTIIDPGVKVENGYNIYEVGKAEGYFVKAPNGEIYVNQVWPGDAVYPDFGREEVRKWWADNQEYLIEMGVRGVWNDMNEPASFKGEIPDDIIFSDEERSATHGEMHNVYGHLMSQATYEGLRAYDKRRPFVITRACYAGSQKYATGWTGDNHSIWAHLQMAIPQLCNLGLSGMSFVGTDIGGFGSDTTPELLARWIQLGCFSPLFRNHSSRGTREQEPWQFDKTTLNIYRQYVELRYKLLPYYYDLFARQEKNGLPIMRPLVLHYEKDERVRALNDEFLVGENLLVAPVVTQGTVKRLVYLPSGKWTDYWSGETFDGAVDLIKEAPLEVCPMYVKAGTILPNYPIQQYVGEREVKELHLHIYKGNGNYLHYQDDGETFEYQKGIYNEYIFSINEQGVFTAELAYQGYNKIYESFLIDYEGKNIRVMFNGLKVRMIL